MTEVRSGAREWRLYLVAVVAGVYVLAWTQIRPKPEADKPIPAARTVWLDELSRDQRPVVAPPAGWRVAARGETIAPTVRRAPAAHPARIRTRSS